MCGLELGVFGKHIDVEKTVQEFAAQGLTMEKVLAEVNGKTRGLPCRRAKRGKNEHQKSG
jgi:hypothetical protein